MNPVKIILLIFIATQALVVFFDVLIPLFEDYINKKNIKVRVLYIMYFILSWIILFFIHIAKKPYSLPNKIGIYFLIGVILLITFLMVWYYFFVKTQINKNIRLENKGCNILEDIILDKDKWKLILENLLNDKIIDQNNKFYGFGPNYSGVKTQIAVFIYFLSKENILKTKNDGTTDKKIVEILPVFFKCSFTAPHYNNIKKTFKDENGIDKNMSHYETYKKFATYI